MQLYYSPDFGYIVCAQTTLRGSVARVTLDPPEVLPPTASDQELDSAVWRSLERSRTARPMDRTEAAKNKFWQVSGINSFNSFSRQFQCLSVTQVGPTLRLCLLERDPDGGYSSPVTGPCIDLPRDRGELGTVVRALFAGQTPPEEERLRTFETVWGSRVVYFRPSDAFLDSGDGHTDAYQVFRQEKYPENVIAFLIGDRYAGHFCQYNEEDVRSVWQSAYGPLEHFEFSRKAGAGPWIEAHGRTAEKVLDTYIFPDGEGTMEVMMESDLAHTPEEDRLRFHEESDAVVRSIHISRQEAPPPPPPGPAPAKGNPLPKKGGERIFFRVQLALTCIAAAIIFYPIYKAWEYMSFAGIGSLILFFFLGPGLVALIVEAVLFFLALWEGKRGYALAAYVIQILCGLPSTCLLMVALDMFYILAVHTVLMVLAVIGLILHLSAAYRRQ